LCFLDLDPIIKDAEKRKESIFIRSINEKFIPNDRIWNTFTYLEDIIMIGYPYGLFDATNNLPINRMGTTASQLMLNFNNKLKYLTDIINFKGSSGSPVFLRQIPFKMELKEENKILLGPKAGYYFVRIHFSGEYQNISSNNPKNPKKESLDSDLILKYFKHLNISHVVKSYKVKDFKPLIFKE